MSPGSFTFAWVNAGAPKGRRVPSGSRGFTSAGLGAVRFIRVLRGSLKRTYESSSSIAFTWVHSSATRDRRVCSGSHGFTPAA